VNVTRLKASFEKANEPTYLPTYGLARIYAKLKETSETSIHLIFIVMNLEKRLRVFILPILKTWENIIFMFRIMIKGALISA